MKYTKSHLSFEDQVKLLQSRNLTISNPNYAKNKLQHISYYRLSAYFIPFYSLHDKFIDGTTFEDVIKVYEFDREFRLLLFNAIERVEVFLRSQIAYHFSKDFGAFGYLDFNNFSCSQKDFDWLQNEIKKEVSRSKETFVSHYRKKYNSDNLPIWMMVELISFGTLSKFFSSLKKEQELKVMDGLTIKPLVFRNWLHVLSYVRNICAHHSRVWNKRLVIKIKIPRNHQNLFENINNETSFSVLTILHFILTKFDNEFDLKNKISQLLLTYPNIDTQQMGFIEDWEDLSIWQS